MVARGIKYLTYWDNESSKPKSEILFCALDKLFFQIQKSILGFQAPIYKLSWDVVLSLGMIFGWSFFIFILYVFILGLWNEHQTETSAKIMIGYQFL